jgi:uncharacterized membrane protein
MNWKFFLIILMLTVVSFANTFLVILAFRKTCSPDGFMNKYGKYILIPVVVVAYNFIIIMGGDKWMYVFASIPFLVMLGLYVFIRFSTETDDPSKMPKKELSNKSKRIHEARQKRHQQQKAAE